MIWGFLHLTGKIEEPLVAGLKRILVLAAVLGVGMRLWLYNTLIVDTFYNAPAQLAAAVVGAADPVGDHRHHLGERRRGRRLSDGPRAGSPSSRPGLGFEIAGVVVWLFIGLLCVYSMFLIALSRIALAVLLALGPLFIAMPLFDATRRFFSSWLAQLANYGLITVLTVMIAALLLQIVKSYAAQTAALGAAILTVDALHMVLVSVLVFLLMRQVMPIASALGWRGRAQFIRHLEIGTISGGVSRAGAHGQILRQTGVARDVQILNFSSRRVCENPLSAVFHVAARCLFVARRAL